jgi:putative DNA primase/helicase
MESVATALHGPPTQVRGTELRYRSKSALAVDTEQQVFYDFESGRGGGVLQLVLNYHGGDTAAAFTWIEKFLAGNPEQRPPRQRVEGQDDGWRRELALRIVEHQLPASGTPAKAYLNGRGITDPAIVEQVGFLPAIRGDDDAMVAVSRDDAGLPVAVQLAFLTPEGEKSPLEPQRLTFKIDPHWSTKGAVRFAGDGDPVVCEGVEDAMSCAQATGRPAMAVLGASNLGRYVPEGTRRLTICPDGDDPDSEAAKAVERAVNDYLLAGVKEVRVARVEWDAETERKVDANDVLRNQGAEALREIIDAAEPADLSYRGEVRRLAAMGPDECAVEIKAVHKAMRKRGIDVSLGDFRASVGRARAEVDAAGPQREVLTSTAPPAEELLEGGVLLGMIVGAIRRLVVIVDHLALLAALYVMFTHVFQRFDCCPRLFITAPTRATGKTRLASVIARMCAGPLSSTNASVAALFRVIDREAPTLVLGEVDTFMKQSEDHRNIVNSGHYREEAFVLRTVGEDFEPKRFSTFAPMVLSGIGKLHRTIMSRSIVIPMRRRLQSEEIARLDREARRSLTRIQSLLARWGTLAGEQLTLAQPPAPIEEVDDRANDNAEPLLAVAGLCGPEWEERARAAMVSAVRAAQDPSEDDLNLLALRDLRDCFAAENQAHHGGVVFTHEVVTYMLKMPDRPWAEMPKTGRPISDHKLGWLLRGLAPTSDRPTRDGERLRGFRWKSCEDAFARYLPAETDPEQPEMGSEAPWGGRSMRPCVRTPARRRF